MIWKQLTKHKLQNICSFLDLIKPFKNASRISCRFMKCQGKAKINFHLIKRISIQYF